jgi:hypothetical protein
VVYIYHISLHTKHINTLSSSKLKDVNVKAGGTTAL